MNALIARYGAEDTEDRLLAEQAKTEALLLEVRKHEQQRTTFFQNISHELRTPLTLILGPLENLLARETETPADNIEDLLEMMARNARRLQDMIDQILDLTRIDTGMVRTKPKAGNINSCVQELVESFSAVYSQRNITIQLKSESPSIDLSYDRELVEKIISNLISNACKFSSSDASVTVYLKRRISPAGIEIAVEDTGPGIPEDSISKIYDRFYQVDSSPTREHEGTGIGLSIVKELIQVMGGDISTSSILGEGTRFDVFLPELEYEIQKPKEIKANKPQTAESPRTVMVVEDNQDMRDYLKSCLEGICDIVEAIDGLDGLEKAKTNAPRLIISDVMMPRMDGITLCRELRKDPELKLIPVILLTARVSHDSVIEGLNAGAVDYIAKPFSFDVLKTKVQGMLQREADQDEVALHDGLTGLFTRAAWEKSAERELKRLERTGGSASLAFLDIDDFKQINDAHGHQAGDRVLSQLAKTLVHQLRSTDLVGRYGGEEFVIFLSDSTEDFAAASLNRIKDLFGDFRIAGDTCTFSAGIAGIETFRMASLAEYISRADSAMYDAKVAGKNKVLIAHSS
ncbi:MAG: diguanylate cyclase [Spirochaetales bacterium]|nr:diguanylate cyclase [Spirochaetales bacterium]